MAIKVAPTPQSDDADPRARTRRQRSPRGAIFWFLISAIGVPLVMLLLVLVLQIPLLLVYHTEIRGGAGLTLLRAIVLPGLFLLVMAVFARFAPPGKRWVVVIGALLVPGFYLLSDAVESAADAARDERAREPIAEIDGSHIVEGFGPIILPNRGGAAEPGGTVFDCASDPVWSQSAGKGITRGAEPEIEWLHEAAQLLEDEGFDVSSGWTLGRRPTDGEPHRIEARMVVFGVRGDDAIFFRSWFWLIDTNDDFPTSNNGISAVRDPCVHDLTLADIDPFLTEPGLPTELPGFTGRW